jgi:hypothetical protein
MRCYVKNTAWNSFEFFTVKNSKFTKLLCKFSKILRKFSKNFTKFTKFYEVNDVGKDGTCTFT